MVESRVLRDFTIRYVYILSARQNEISFSRLGMRHALYETDCE